MSWCDRSASTAGLGVRVTTHFASGAALLDAVAPILDKFSDERAQGFDIERADQFQIQFSTNAGYQYTLSQDNAYIEYIYRLQIDPQSGAPPKARILNRVIPYSEQLAELSELLTTTVALMPQAKTRTITRIGVISATNAEVDEYPPGIRNFISYIGRPWQQALDGYGFRITAQIAGQQAGIQDRCIHTINRPEIPPASGETLVTVKLDWQRSFDTGRRIERKTMHDLISDAIRDANHYFDDLAQGDRFDEDILRAPE